ncbi:MAG: PmoA family protein [Blastocatellia bacterium]
MRKLYFCLLIIALATLIPRFETGASGLRAYVKVAAGSLDRRETIVTFSLPKDLKAKSYALRDESGRMIALQVDAERQATFVLSELKAGATKNYRLVESKASAAIGGNVHVARIDDQLTIDVAGRRAFSYREQPSRILKSDIKEIFRRGGYLDSVYTPLGRSVTDDYPPDHYHHHGIWFAWTKTEFEGRHPDFWNMGDGTGKVEFVAVDSTWSGSVHGGFTSSHRYVDLSGSKPMTVLNEEWKVAVYKIGLGEKPYSMFDMIVTHECAASSPLVLPEYRYGGIGFRGHRQWLEKDNCFFLTSEGKDRSNGHGTRARWCHIGGRIDGQLAGIAILDHPANFRAPQPMRINPDQPFFCYAPSLMGQWEITPGKPYVSRYRFIVYDGGPDKVELDRLWNDYANPPQIAITVE